MHTTQEKRKAAGLCPRCGGIKDSDKYNCKSCTEKARLKARQRAALYPDRCSRCKARDPDPPSAYCAKCQESSRISSIKHREKIKREVFEAYGGACVCCGNTNIRHFTLDHINNDGADHRKEIKIPMVRWAYNNDCPDILQALCAGCHHVKTYYGRCLPSDHSLLVLDTSSES